MTDKCLRIVMAGMIAAALLTAFLAAIQPETACGTPAGLQVATAPGQESMSALATKVLHRIVEARAAIHSGETKRAEGALHEALALIERIKAVRPSTRIADHIWVAEWRLDYKEPREVALDLIPIEVSLGDLEEVLSVQRAKRHLQETKTHLDRGDTEAARQEIQRLRDSLAQTEVDLPLASTERNIGKAFAKLKEGNADEADQALEDAEAGVRFVSLSKSAPLVKARRALWQAMEDYSAGHHEAVEAELTRALGWLERVQGGADAETQREAQRLHAEIRELLERERHKTAEAESELTGFWHRSVGLVERQAEKLYHAWRDQQTENHVYGQLINAKMHLHRAEHELFESGDAEDARQELEKTVAYLRRAAEADVSGERKSGIEKFEEEVAALVPLAAKPDEKAHGRYDKVMADLRRMLQGI